MVVSRLYRFYKPLADIEERAREGRQTLQSVEIGRPRGAERFHIRRGQCVDDDTED